MLLPKLISGELDVSEMDIKTPDDTDNLSGNKSKCHGSD